MADQDLRQHMLECEARTWLRNGYTTQDKVRELQELIAKKRGNAAAERLRQEMRRQWQRRREWLGGGNG